MDGLAHWDDARSFDADVPPVRGRWRDLGRAAHSVAVGVVRIDIAPGFQSTPVHAHGVSEEIFYVLEGAGFLWMDGSAWAVAPGDGIVHRPGPPGHTLRAGPDGLSVLAFGTRPGAEPALHARSDTELVFGFRRRDHPSHPWSLESGLEPVDVSTVSPQRPRFVVALDDPELAAERRDRAGVHRSIRRIGAHAGAQRSGLTHFTVDAGALANVPHQHSADEELFVILEGDGTLELSDVHDNALGEHALTAGSVVARPAGSRVAHAIRAGEGGLRMLGYSDHHPGDVCFYPRSQKISMRGLGVIFRVSQVDYFDGEE